MAESSDESETVPDVVQGEIARLRKQFKVSEKRKEIKAYLEDFKKSIPKCGK